MKRFKHIAVLAMIFIISACDGTAHWINPPEGEERMAAIAKKIEKDGYPSKVSLTYKEETNSTNYSYKNDWDDNLMTSYSQVIEGYECYDLEKLYYYKRSVIKTDAKYKEINPNYVGKITRTNENWVYYKDGYLISAYRVLEQSKAGITINKKEKSSVLSNEIQAKSSISQKPGRFFMITHNNYSDDIWTSYMRQQFSLLPYGYIDKSNSKFQDSYGYQTTGKAGNIIMAAGVTANFNKSDITNKSVLNESENELLDSIEIVLSNRFTINDYYYLTLKSDAKILTRDKNNNFFRNFNVKLNSKVENKCSVRYPKLDEYTESRQSPAE